jgi:hypothetical protein
LLAARLGALRACVLLGVFLVFVIVAFRFFFTSI